MHGGHRRRQRRAGRPEGQVHARGTQGERRRRRGTGGARERDSNTTTTTTGRRRRRRRRRSSSSSSSIGSGGGGGRRSTRRRRRHGVEAQRRTVGRTPGGIRVPKASETRRRRLTRRVSSASAPNNPRCRVGEPNAQPNAKRQSPNGDPTVTRVQRGERRGVRTGNRTVAGSKPAFAVAADTPGPAPGGVPRGGVDGRRETRRVGLPPERGGGADFQGCRLSPRRPGAAAAALPGAALPGAGVRAPPARRRRHVAPPAPPAPPAAAARLAAAVPRSKRREQRVERRRRRGNARRNARGWRTVHADDDVRGLRFGPFERRRRERLAQDWPPGVRRPRQNRHAVDAGVALSRHLRGGGTGRVEDGRRERSIARVRVRHVRRPGAGERGVRAFERARVTGGERRAVQGDAGVGPGAPTNARAKRLEQAA